MSREPIIALENLHRTFTVRQRIGRVRRQTRVVHAVDGITASILAGEAVGYIGANGAGKSTTIKMLTGILVPTSRASTYLRLQPGPAAALARSGDRGGVRAAQPAVVGPAAARLVPHPWRDPSNADHGQPRPEPRSWWSAWALPTCWTSPVRQLSLGERMRGEVAAALIHRPRLLVLDEPTIGLDMISKERLRHFLLAERAEFGTTLLLTTHDMGDIERLCERVLVVDRGRLVFDGTLSSLAARVALQRVLVVDLPEPGPDLRVAAATHIGSELDGQRQRLAFSPQQTTAARVLAEVTAMTEVIDLTLEEPAIEDIVRTLYGAP